MIMLKRRSLLVLMILGFGDIKKGMLWLVLVLNGFEERHQSKPEHVVSTVDHVLQVVCCTLIYEHVLYRPHRPMNPHISIEKERIGTNCTRYP